MGSLGWRTLHRINGILEERRRERALRKIFLISFFFGEIWVRVNTKKLTDSVHGSCLSFQRKTSQREADMCGTLLSFSMINAPACSLCLPLQAQSPNIGTKRSNNLYEITLPALKTHSTTQIRWLIDQMKFCEITSLLQGKSHLLCNVTEIFF